ncbi:MAG: FABP family protein [Catenulispora sp.]|nr:FABP family protein [Catenulispora sp.]
MPLEIPSDLHPNCVPLAFLLGTWAGAGVGGYPTIESFNFGQEVTFSYTPEKPFLKYESRSWLLDDEGNQVRPLAQESGYWRPQARTEENGTAGTTRTHLEVLLAHPTGISEIWVGEADGAKIELRTDVVARTETAKEYTAGHRLYGLVQGDLLWAFDMAAMGQPMQSHLSAQLKPVR